MTKWVARRSEHKKLLSISHPRTPLMNFPQSRLLCAPASPRPDVVEGRPLESAPSGAFSPLALRSSTTRSIKSHRVDGGSAAAAGGAGGQQSDPLVPAVADSNGAPRAPQASTTW